LLIGETPLVLTSGNISDEPIARTNFEARQRLSNLADCFLLHDREIHVVCDDSVVRCVEGELLPIRRSRGYAPMPVRLFEPGPSVLAVGGEIKSAFCLTKDEYAYLSQHIGDMGNIETLDALRRGVQHFLRLFRVNVKAVAADLHPGYLSGQWASEFANSLDVPLIRVQHHFAHVAGLIAEHDLPSDQRIIGCCFDGTGYGTDEAIWGGEFLLASERGFDRFAQLKYTPLPGGDASIRRPYRVAMAQLWACGLAWDEDLPSVAFCPAAEKELLRQQLEKNLNCVSTSSMGRLFDAIASLIGIRHEVNYEAQAAMEMEALAANAIDRADPVAYAFTVNRTSAIEVDNAELLRKICADIRSDVESAIMAAQFHHAVANLVVDVCQLVREEAGIKIVGLTGGVFQNVLLLRLTRKLLRDVGFEVLTHSIVPPNDGGLALGQAVMARNRLQAKFAL
jgi:hydrogenase maturation protein HypF